MTLTPKYIMLALTTILSLSATYSQPITLSNPSFEDSRQLDPGVAPKSWQPCGKAGANTPDVQPGQFNVYTEARHGETYMGLVVRDNDTWEGVSQRLRTPLQAGQCYGFILHLARSKTLTSQSRLAREKYGKTEYVRYSSAPVRLRIWGGNGPCLKAEKLAESYPVINSNWKEYVFQFQPKKRYKYLIFEAYYRTDPTLVPYNGNVLVDHASDITPMPCDDDVRDYVEQDPPALATNDKPVKVKPPKKYTPKKTKPEKPSENGIAQNKTKPIPPTSKPASAQPGPSEPQPIEKTSTTDSTNPFDNLFAGKKIRIENLYFEANSAHITETSYPALNEVYQFLKENEGLVVEIGGHTNNRCGSDFCNKLSKERAKAVSHYLQNKGIANLRLSCKGYGKRFPANNSTAQGHKQNQRVEIKILSLN